MSEQDKLLHAQLQGFMQTATVVGVVTLLINDKFLKIMAKLDDIQSILSEINDSTNNISADLQRLADQIEAGQNSGGLSSADTDSVIAQLRSAADKLKAVADVNAEPVVEEPVTEPEPVPDPNPTPGE